MQENLATELLREVKATSKRWFIIAMVELGIILAIVGAFLWYNTLPVESVALNGENGIAAYIGNDNRGDIVNGECESE